ncbi:phosphotransferase [Paenibacillus rhizovicinus]|uniref:Phosphotransferase n=1 Tax=Paenibacillus rhizovicinus TaxID=2704463 RepID=A0A6C0NWD7_9BACL|nr:phosphotransferase [Paenibacillus rhizovicinus]QHW30517.1 phosphotransferase [Paenibacillus rhizovicinus]
MNSGFLMDTDRNRQLTLKQTKQAALNALRQYEVDWTAIHFIQVSEHVTFRVESSEGGKFLLRIHPSNKASGETLSELEWLAALGRKGLTVPEAVPNRQAAFITKAATIDGQQYETTLLRWIEGERMGKGELTEARIRTMGSLMAKLHEASADFGPGEGFARPAWGSESFNRDWEHLKKHRESFISDEAMELYAMAAAKVANQLSTFVPHRQHYGMIHADLHIGNIVFHEEEPFAIDFGRCGFGYHLYDIAQSIMGLYPPQRALFIEGYESVKRMNDNAVPMLECFFIMSIIEAYSFHAENELETEGLIEEQPYAQAILSAYVNGQPFLFQPLG